MVKSKTSSLAKLPKDQRCQFLIGPINSWFMPNISDLWTQPKITKSRSGEIKLKVSQDDIMDCEQSNFEDNPSLSYFIYGSIGCFCYGEIHRLASKYSDNKTQNGKTDSSHSVSAYVNRLIDIKEDRSRVSCIRFLKTCPRPVAMILTENGSFLVHDCLSSENLVFFKRAELVSKYVQKFCNQAEQTDSEHFAKKPRLNATQQITSCLWPHAKNAFLGVSLLKEKTNLVLWLKLKELNDYNQTLSKDDFVVSHEKLELTLPEYSNPICCMESAMLESNVCLLAIGTDDGLITVAEVDFEKGAKPRRVFKFDRHRDQVCSMSFFVDSVKKFPSGLLASVSRDGLVLVWDIEREFYFADYLASPESVLGNSRINWFALRFITPKDSKQITLAVSNPDSGLTTLDLPENTRSKIRLREIKETKQSKKMGEQTIRHHALLFNVAYDSNIETILTTSLDGNHILWDVCRKDSNNRGVKREGQSVEIKPRFLYPSMTNNSRTHMLRHNPIKEDLLGVALGKAGLRFYTVSKNQMNRRFDMNPSCGLICRKINKLSLSPTSLAWHPGHEYRLAVGTLEGKVLRADITPRKATLVEAEHKPIPISRLAIGDEKMTQEEQEIDKVFDVEYQPMEHDSSKSIGINREDCGSVENLKFDGVYSLCWGPNPICPQDITRSAIYAVGSISHRLFIYYNKKDSSDKLTNYLDEFLDQSIPEAIGESSEVTWKSSMDLMALGTTNGKIIIARYIEESSVERSNGELFRKLAVIQGPLGNSYIQCLVWHPTTDLDDLHYYYLAASSNVSPAFVFNLKENMLVDDVRLRLKIDEPGCGDEDKNKKDLTTNVVSSYIHKLSAHEKAISDIQWNPHKPDQLATSSFDRCCYVWSLEDTTSPLTESFAQGCAQIVGKFSARDRLFTVEWSLVDPDLLLTSGNDSTIWAWRPTENISLKSTTGGSDLP